MRRIIIFFMALAVTTGIYACTGGSSNNPNGAATMAPDKKVEVFYFHFTRRCMTCNNVEKVSKEAVEKQFAAQVKRGEITFLSVNLDEKDGQAIGAKHKVEGQSLIIISGDKRVDLTDKGFMYANNSPEKLKAEIKKVVESMIK